MPEMTPFDWDMLGWDISKGTLPMKRLQIPIPASKGKFPRLAHDLSGFILQIQELHRNEYLDDRHALRDLIDLMRNTNHRLQILRHQWEGELLQVEKQGPDNVEPLRNILRT